MATNTGTEQARWDSLRLDRQPGAIPIPVEAVRKLMGYSVREFAALLPPHNGKKWSAAQISYVENGQRSVGPELLAAIQAFVEIHVPPRQVEGTSIPEL